MSNFLTFASTYCKNSAILKKGKIKDNVVSKRRCTYDKLKFFFPGFWSKGKFD
jgi:hypothetical protein